MVSITIAIPYYSGFSYFQAALQSALQQSISDYKILVVDNSADDQVKAYVESLGQRRINYHKNPTNLGMIGNFNRCLNLASTELVVILHADDELDRDYCKSVQAAAKDYPEAVGFFCAATIIDEKGKRKFSFADYVKTWLIPSTKEVIKIEGDIGASSLMRGNYIFAPTLCFRKCRLGDRRFAEKWKQVLDLDLVTRVLIEGEHLVGLPQSRYRYRRHGGNATLQHTANLLRFDEEVQIYNELSVRFREKGWIRAADVARKKTMIKLNLMYCFAQDVLSLRVPAARSKLKFFYERLLRS
jgi:glycosyltransferase involved in cell wall biosynthesis